MAVKGFKVNKVENLLVKFDSFVKLVDTVRYKH
jgi:hypothetical protein